MLMDAALVENMTDPSILFDEFQSQGTSYVLAARVSGEIISAFPEGRPEFQRKRSLMIKKTRKFLSFTDPASSDNAAITSDAAEILKRSQQNSSGANSGSGKYCPVFRY